MVVAMIFPLFANIEWSKLTQAVTLESGRWQVPDDIPLATLLQLPPARRSQLRMTQITCLRISKEETRVLSKNGITSVGQLIKMTLGEVKALPAMGYGLTVALFKKLSVFLINPAPVLAGSPRPLPPAGLESPRLPTVRRRAAPLPLPGPEFLEPLTLGHEWELFGGPPPGPPSLTRMALSDAVRRRLEEAGRGGLDPLLDQTYAHVCEVLGDDGAEEVAGVLTDGAAEAARTCPQRRDRARILEERWGLVPVSALEIGGAGMRALRRARVATVAELLAATEPLHVELALDPQAFAQVWAALKNVGLREEDWEDAGERLSEEAYARTGLDHIVKAWREGAKGTWWGAASARFGLESGPGESPWRMPTLEEVATRFGVTRERVRQVEMKFIKSLAGAQDEYFVALQNTLAMIVAHAGGVVSLERAAEDLAEWINPGHAAPEGVCRLVLNNSPLFLPVRKNAIYVLASAPFGAFDSLVNAAQSLADTILEDWTVATLAERLAATGEGGHTSAFIAACLEASDRFGAARRVPAEADLVRLLRELGSPRHFTEITDRLNEAGWRPSPVTYRYVHNHLLSRRDLFVHVAPGTYGLAEWGLEDQRVERGGALIGDLAAEFLEALGSPTSGEDIVAYVQARKTCRNLSVWQCLSYDPRFQKLDRNKYGLARWVF